ncbi:uncharacterized protein [Leuresthes tenuis]|uniref:uncharacterized protein isoform X3 n=1 Tax=Leuresthes tenuis TaxID=355514 RepID=UPI003B515036
MARSGMCCGSLAEPAALMKMGLSLIVIGHVNFLLGALVHGVVLRHINLHKQARALEYAVSNVIALASGMVGAVVGIIALILSKNKKSRGLSTTLILWVPLIVTCIIQLVFSARCFAACVSFLGLPCCPTRKRAGHYAKAINVVRPVKDASHSRYTEPPRSHNRPTKSGMEPLRSHNVPTQLNTEPPRIHSKPPRRATAPPRQHDRPPPPPPPPQHLSRQHRSLPPSERQPLHQPYRERSDRERPERRTGSQQRAPEQHQLLQRGTLERSSFWI